MLKQLHCLKQQIRIFQNQDNDLSLSQPENIAAEKYYDIFYLYLAKLIEKQSDLVIQFKVAEGYTTRLAIYFNEENIKQNSNGEFIDALYEYEVNTKEIVITKEQLKTLEDSVVYIVIYNLVYKKTDSFKVFSESNEEYLVSNHCYYISRLYSRGSRIYFTSNNYTNVYIAVNLNYYGNSSPNLEIREEDSTGRLFKSYTELRMHEVIQHHKSLMYFVFKAKNGVDPSEVYNVNFCFTFLTKRIINVYNGDINEKVFTYDMPMYYKLNLGKYELNEENSLMLKFDYNVINPYDGFYCKFVKDSPIDDQLIDKYPKGEEDNECAVVKDELIDTSYHMYIKHSTIDLNALLILVKVKGEFVYSSGFHLHVMSAIREIKASSIERDLDISIPRYYKINPNAITDNVIISTNSDIGISIILGSLSNGKTATKPTYHAQFYGVNRKQPNEQEQPIVYIKLYSGLEPVTFEQLFLHQRVAFLEGQKRSGTAQSISKSIPINNCNIDTYYIANFIVKSYDFLSVDIPYGKGTVYYQNSYLASNTIQENLPAEEEVNEVSRLVKVQNDVDIIKIKCTIPTLVNINYLPQEKPSSEFKVGDSLNTIIPLNQQIQYDINPIYTMGLEARISTDESLIEIIVNGEKKTELNKSNKVYTQTIMKDEKCKVAFTSLSSFESTLSLSLGGIDLYPTPIIQSGITRQQHILIELDKTKQFYAVDINIVSTDKTLTLCVLHGFYDKHYIPLPRYNCQSMTNTYALTIVNPYDKYVSSINAYYIALNADKIPTDDIMIEINYQLKEQAETVNEGQIKKIDTNELRVRTIKSNDNSKELFYYSFTPCSNQKMGYQILFNKELLFAVQDSSDPSTVALKNILSDIDIQFTTGKGIFNYNYINQKDYDDFKLLGSTSIDITSKTDKVTIKFKPLIIGTKVQYDIYVIKSEDKQTAIDQCALFNIQPYDTITLTKDTDDDIEHQLKVATEGKYQINIVATTKEGITASRSYIVTEATIIIEKPPDIKPTSLTWLWILLGCIGAIGLITIIIVLIVKYYKEKETKPDSAEPFDIVID